jgi:hypothetical protein
MRRSIVPAVLGLIATAGAAVLLAVAVRAVDLPESSEAFGKVPDTTAAEGCALVFSTEATDCSVESTGLVTRSNSIVLGIHNTGAGLATIRQLDVYWPARDSNGALEKVQLGSQTIWQGSRFDSPTTIGLSSVAVPSIPGGAPADLTLTFAGEARPQHYVVQVEFVEGCHLYFSTRGTGEACQVVAGNPWTEGNTANVTLQNLGISPTELRGVEVSWPSESGGSLVALILGRQLLWSGRIRSSPAMVIPDPSLVFTPSLVPGESQRLILTFTAEHVPGGPYSVDVAFVEGCHAFASNAEGATPARVVRFTGVIRQLPPGLLGEWQVDGNRVLVDARTVIKPPRVQPGTGDLAKVIALSQPDDELLALTIEITPSAEPRKVEFRGIIQDYDPGARFIVVNARQVVWDDTTDIQGELRLGWIAQVTGELLPDDRTRAQSIVTAPPEETAARVEFKGPIVSWSEARPSTWVIGSLTVTVDYSTLVLGGPIRIGALAEVKAVARDGAWPLAQEVRVPQPGEPGTIRRVIGALQTLPGGLAAGEWTVRDETSTQVLQIEADNRTFIDQSRARARIGDRVVADITWDATTGRWRAVHIEVLRPE